MGALVSTMLCLKVRATFWRTCRAWSKSKVEIENTDRLPAAYWDPVLKRNRSKRLQLFARLLAIGLLRPRLNGAAKHFLGIFFVDKKGKKQKRLILDARIVNWSFVSPPGVSLCSSEAMGRIEVCLPAQAEEGSRAWHSALESIELSLGLGDIRDCFHRYVLDDEFASCFVVDTVLASELSLSGSYLEGSLLDDHAEVAVLWCCLPVPGSSWCPFSLVISDRISRSRA